MVCYLFFSAAERPTAKGNRLSKSPHFAQVFGAADFVLGGAGEKCPEAARNRGFPQALHCLPSHAGIGRLGHGIGGAACFCRFAFLGLFFMALRGCSACSGGDRTSSVCSITE